MLSNSCTVDGCKRNGKSFSRPADLRKHEQECHNPTRYLCNQAGCSWKGAKTQSGYKSHMMKHHGIKDDNNKQLVVPPNFTAFATSTASAQHSVQVPALESQQETYQTSVSSTETSLNPMHRWDSPGDYATPITLNAKEKLESSEKEISYSMRPCYVDPGYFQPTTKTLGDADSIRAMFLMGTYTSHPTTYGDLNGDQSKKEVLFGKGSVQKKSKFTGKPLFKDEVIKEEQCDENPQSTHQFDEFQLKTESKETLVHTAIKKEEDNSSDRDGDYIRLDSPTPEIPANHTTPSNNHETTPAESEELEDPSEEGSSISMSVETDDDHRPYSRFNEVLDLLKKQTVANIMEDFWWCFQQRTSHGAEDCTPSSSGKRSAASTSITAPSSKASSRKRGLESIQNQGSDDEDANEEYPAKRPHHVEKEAILQPPFACPYRKHDNLKYNVNDWRICATTALNGIHRVKDHLFKKHRIHQCARCTEVFKDQDELDKHGQLPESCKISSSKLADGVTTSIELRLRRRKKSYPGQPDSDIWREIYEMLFPGDLPPNPYFVPVIDSLRYPGLDHLEEFARIALPVTVRNIVDRSIGHDFDQLRERYGEAQIGNIAQRCVEKIIADYRISQQLTGESPHTQLPDSFSPTEETDERSKNVSSPPFFISRNSDQLLEPKGKEREHVYPTDLARGNASSEPEPIGQSQSVQTFSNTSLNMHLHAENLSNDPFMAPNDPRNWLNPSHGLEPLQFDLDGNLFLSSEYPDLDLNLDLENDKSPAI